MIENRKLKLLDQVRQIIRIKHYSLRTEESYVNWIKRFIFFMIRNIPKKWEGHKNVETTMIYTNVINQGGKGLRSPTDLFV